MPDWGRVTAQVPSASSLQWYEEALQELWTVRSDHGQFPSFPLLSVTTNSAEHNVLQEP